MHSTAAAVAAGKTEAWALTGDTPDGWDAALGLAAAALARLVTDKRFAGGGGGGGGGTTGKNAAFAASLAAAQALLDHYMHAGSQLLKEDTMVSEAIAGPLQYGPAYTQQQREHLARIGSALDTVMTRFAEANDRAAVAGTVATHIHSGGAAAGRGRGGSAASGLAAGACSGSQGTQLALAARMYLLARTAPFVTRALERFGDAGSAAWQPWSQAIAACLQRLAPTAADMGERRCGEQGRDVYAITMMLLQAAEPVLRVATRGGMGALQRTPLPALLEAVATACRLSPAAYGATLRVYEQPRFSLANAACDVIAAVATAVEEFYSQTPPQLPPPWSPELLRSACCAIPTLLRERPFSYTPQAAMETANCLPVHGCGSVISTVHVCNEHLYVATTLLHQRAHGHIDGLKTYP